MTPFAAANGAKALSDGPTDYAKIHAHVESKNVAWAACTRPSWYADSPRVWSVGEHDLRAHRRDDDRAPDRHHRSGCRSSRRADQGNRGLHRRTGLGDRDVVPMYSLMVATEPLTSAVWVQIGLNERTTFSDGRHLRIYGQRTADGRFAFGGRGAPYHFGSRISRDFDTDARVHAMLRRILTELFPIIGT